MLIEKNVGIIYIYAYICIYAQLHVAIKCDRKWERLASRIKANIAMLAMPD